MHMSQPTRIVFEVVLLGLCLFCVATFVVQHFMTSPRPSWHKELPNLALLFAFASTLVRSFRRRRARRMVG